VLEDVSVLSAVRSAPKVVESKFLLLLLWVEIAESWVTQVNSEKSHYT
jgi:hypothetical protein